MPPCLALCRLFDHSQAKAFVGNHHELSSRRGANLQEGNIFVVINICPALHGAFGTFQKFLTSHGALGVFARDNVAVAIQNQNGLHIRHVAQPIHRFVQFLKIDVLVGVAH